MGIITFDEFNLLTKLHSRPPESDTPLLLRLDPARQSHNFRMPHLPFSIRIGMDVETNIKLILVNKFQVANDIITTDAEFNKDLGLDSLDIIELVIELASAFNIHIPDEDAASILTFGDAVTCVQAGDSIPKS